MIDVKLMPTDAPSHLRKKEIKSKTKSIVQRIAELQLLLAAERKHSLLIVFQGMDSSGKDGAAKNVFNRCGPVGINAYGFKKPTEIEFAHDFMWRVGKLAPIKGGISIFCRSHYEDVLIQRVHNWIDEDKVTKRLKTINSWEETLQYDNNTTVLKFFLNLSYERQEEKLQERIDIPEKNWKHKDGDWEERKHWDNYMDAYNNAINKSVIPWYIIPVDQRWYRDYKIAQIILETLEGFKMSWPKLQTNHDPVSKS